MDFSGDDFYDDEVTSGLYDDDPNPYDGTLSEGGDDADDLTGDPFGEDTIFDTFGDEADPFGGDE